MSINDYARIISSCFFAGCLAFWAFAGDSLPLEDSSSLVTDDQSPFRSTERFQAGSLQPCQANILCGPA